MWHDSCNYNNMQCNDHNHNYNTTQHDDSAHDTTIICLKRPRQALTFKVPREAFFKVPRSQVSQDNQHTLLHSQAKLAPLLTASLVAPVLTHIHPQMGPNG